MTAEPPTPRDQCQATVYVPETYRRTGRSKSRFELHYIRQQCSRRVLEGGYCWQHDADVDRQAAKESTDAPSR